ncbi:phenylalanine--tRNA ligase subunit beta [Pseudoramibacter alactolyticus]|uniref:phenylalanine--tRNA ligase subunit beta n=1 Tax=Pseudoramibacter alactolyticus TaxID=113287 RepID=UPI00248E2A57|nr:phenylalanine--tRNA ligase subunit beta [Pseudoramibacter alactolyticus]
MLVSLNWLKEYVNVDQDVKTFGDILTMTGTKVETIQPVNPNVQGILTGKITRIAKHPNADKLQICDVDFGDQTLPIITSAKNVFVGAVVPVAVAGSVIADGSKMKPTSFRGIESPGMMCSVEEMGLDTGLFSQEIMNGIYILPEDTKLGQEIRDLFWVNDQIIDVELTANRSDCQSIYGIAREAAAALDEPIEPITLYQEAQEIQDVLPIENFLKVSVESDLCPRYTARMFKVNKIEPSPIWMQRKLLNSGVRPINNIVDVTNYVMLEVGQPLHAFDYQSIGSQEIIVKQCDDQSVTTLDGQERAIDAEMLMITNGRKPIAVAGIMGGLNSEITDQTEYVVLESACFDKTSVRKTSRKTGLRTEASARYEKGTFPGLCEVAALRAAYLFESIGACEVIPGMIDIYPHPEEAHTITVDPQWISRFLGIDISADDIVKILNRLFLEVQPADGQRLKVIIPEYRRDLRIREDIAEEVARIYGYDHIPNTIMGGTTLVGLKTDAQVFKTKIEDLLIGSGYFQTMTTSFTSLKTIHDMQMDEVEAPVVIMNPLGEDSAVMRFTLAGEQLSLIALNHSRKNPSGRFFEIASTYHVNSDTSDLPIETKHLVMTSYNADDFYSFKGVTERILAEVGRTSVRFEAGGDHLFHPGRKAIISIDGVSVGQMGEIHPIVAKKFALPKHTLLAEFDFNILTEMASDRIIHFDDLPKYPSSNRDLAVIVPEALPSSAVWEIIEDHHADIMESIDLFDVYRGEQIGEGKKSLAFSMTFRHAERTLTDDDINPIVDAIVSDLETKLHAQLRDE